MDKSKSPQKSPRENIIKIKLLDIFPSIIELKQQQKELDIIFQGLDIFYNLYELLNNKTELTLNIKNKNSIIISLIKSNNIFATCVFHIKKGDHWITFSYENKKKKETNFVQSLIDCIKIKLNCELSKNPIKNKNNKNIFLNTKKLNHNNNNIKNNYLKQNSNYSSLTTDDNLKLPNKINKLGSNKLIKNISMECSSKDKINESVKYSYIKYDYSKNNKSNKELNILNRIKTKNNLDYTKYDNLALRLNKIVDINEESKLNLTQKHKNKNGNNNNLNPSINGNKFSNNKLYNNFDFDTSKKGKKIIKNKLLNSNTYNNELNNLKYSKYYNKNIIEKSQDNIESIYISSSLLGNLTNRNNQGSKKEIKNIDNIINNKNNSKTPLVPKINKFQNTQNIMQKEKKNKNKQSPEFTHDYNNEQSSSNGENKNDNDNINNISNLDDDYINEYNSYEKLKEDFILLYNDNYVKNVQEDLLKLEIELFVEKLVGLISAYNQEINEKKIKNKIIETNLKEIESKYLKMKKLYYKLKLIRKKMKQNNAYIRNNKNNLKLIENNEFEINKQQINLFNLFYLTKYNNIDYIKSNKNPSKDKQELKNILNIILTNSKSKIKKDFVQNDKINNKLDNITKLENNEVKYKYKYTKPKARTRVIPSLQQTKINTKDIKSNINEENIENNNNDMEINKENIKDNFNFSGYDLNIQNLYNKKIYKTETYNPNKTYSKKIPK